MICDSQSCGDLQLFQIAEVNFLLHGYFNCCKDNCCKIAVNYKIIIDKNYRSLYNILSAIRKTIRVVISE